MVRLALILAAVIGLGGSPAWAKTEPSTTLEPISVAVAPPDNGIPAVNIPAAVPAAESKAAPAKLPPPDEADASKPGAGHARIVLKIEPFGWRIGLIGR